MGPPHKDGRLGSLLYITTILGIGIMMANFISCDAKDVAIDKEPIDLSALPTNVCFTAACNRTASQIIKDMDKSVDPCSDFYQFVCGNFLRDTHIPDDKNSIHSFDKITDEVQDQIRKVIAKPALSHEASYIKLVKNLYSSCMDEDSITKQGVKPLLQILDALGGWPVVKGDNWNDKDFNWIESVYKFRDVGFSIDFFMSFSVFADLANTSKRIIHIDQPSFGLDHEYISKGMDDDIVQAYFEYMYDIAVLLGASEKEAKEQLLESLKFEIALAKISLPNEKRRNITLLHNPITLKELSEKHPGIPWRKYSNVLLAPVLSVDEKEIVNVISPSYISDLVVLIKATPPRTQANYAMWRSVQSIVSYLSEDVRKFQLKYTSKLDGKVKRPPRWNECVKVVSDSLSLSVGSLYIEKYFSENARKNAIEMVHDIKNQFSKILEEVDWMDEVTRENALEKAAIMDEHVAYPDELRDEEKLKTCHKGLYLSDEFYLGNMLNLSIFQLESSLYKLRDPVNKSDWRDHGRAAVVNAFYSFLENSIQLPAAILQERFFDNDRPKYLNYGAIGFFVAHEITHGFDDIGRQFDQHGNLVGWWSQSAREQYLQKAECVINQYSNYIDPEVGLNLNGRNTQGENIADNGGVKTAYHAYREWASRNSMEQSLPGLDYTPEQMFWISTANVWCVKERPESRNTSITNDVHSPAEFRVIGSFSNSIDFANDFKCSEGTKMNPSHKCAVW